MSVKTAWSVDVGKSGESIFIPAFTDNSIIAAAADGKLIRLDNANGRLLWQIDAPTSLIAGVGADATTFAVVGDKGLLLTYDLDGKLRWQAQLSSEVLAPPAVGHGVVVVRGLNNHIAAYDSTTGKRRWSVERALPPLILRSAAGMAMDDKTLFAGLPGGKLIAIDLASGNLRWEAVVADAHGATELERVSDVSGTPVVVGSEVCAAAYQGRVACFNSDTGAMRWAKPLSTSVGVAADVRYVFAADDKGVVNAFNRNAGLQAWKNDQLTYRGLSGPVSFGRAVAVADSEGYIHFLAREDGLLLARASTDGSAVLAMPIVAGDRLVFQTTAGDVVAFSTE
jgi:outer membrane protein assembly factor BamB